MPQTEHSQNISIKEAELDNVLQILEGNDTEFLVFLGIQIGDDLQALRIRFDTHEFLVRINSHDFANFGP